MVIVVLLLFFACTWENSREYSWGGTSPLTTFINKGKWKQKRKGKWASIGNRYRKRGNKGNVTNRITLSIKDKNTASWWGGKRRPRGIFVMWGGGGVVGFCEEGVVWGVLPYHCDTTFPPRKAFPAWLCKPAILKRSFHPWWGRALLFKKTLGRGKSPPYRPSPSNRMRGGDVGREIVHIRRRDSRSELILKVGGGVFCFIGAYFPTSKKLTGLLLEKG